MLDAWEMSTKRVIQEIEALNTFLKTCDKGEWAYSNSMLQLVPLVIELEGRQPE